jgi:uncharacterized 2Fe-2S/4Fe-4S cluster protein (DUF4445 family)
MEVLRDFNVYIDEKEVLRLLGYKDGEPDEEIVESVREEIERAADYIMPAVAFDKIGIKAVEANGAILDNGVILEGEFIANKLRNCQYVVVCITTAGYKLDSEVKAAFDSGDYLKGMIVDNIGTISVEYINKSFWNQMVDSVKGSDIGITSRLSPGDTAWNIKEQRKIFQCIDSKTIGVTLTESCMMVPFKSTSAVYGFGKEIGITRLGHVCAECSMKHCAYRMDGKLELIINKEGNKEIFDVRPGSNLLDVLREKDVFVSSPCSGKGICGKCKVQIIKGIVEPVESDRKHLSVEEINRGIRLSCNVSINKPTEIKIVGEETKMSVLTEGTEVDMEINPVIDKRHCIVKKPSVEDQRDDLRRLGNALNIKNIKARYRDLSSISSNLRTWDFNVTAAVYEDRLLQLEEGNMESKSYGLAVDIGTTTIACYLVDLNTGKNLDVESQVNKQRAFGADVISRINYTIEKEEGLEKLKASIIEQLNEIFEIICSRNSISLQNIYDVVVVGNTTMIHLFLGMPCKNIAMAPYIPVTTSAMVYEGSELGLQTGGIVSIVPGIASYVGSDITAGILSSGMLNSEKYSLLLDLGTNGEIALGNKREVITCSTAAGPAFEGANIKHGTGGIRGAIAKVDLSRKSIYETIDGAVACGICGSGVLDTAAQLLKYGVVDETGRMVDEDEIEDVNIEKRMINIDGMKSFILEENSSKGEAIVFTQKDIREIQLAKAAICAGINILLKEKGISCSDVENVYIGGGFGNYMNIESALEIGMLPSSFAGRIKSIGNCAGTGARMYLLSKKLRKETAEAVERTSYVELSKRDDFQDYFIDSMMLDRIL